MTTTVVLPRITEIGAGSSLSLPNVLRKLGVSKPLIVTDPALIEFGVLTEGLTQLEDEGISFGVFSDISPDPSTAEVDALASAYSEGFDGLVAVGGGSPMDTAKAAAIRGSYDDRPLRELKAPFAADTRNVPLICIPTTAGTGAEVTRFCVITDVDTNEKMLIAGNGCVPDAALVDVRLSMSMPKRVTADTGLDALTHGLEAFISQRANEHADIFAISGVKRVLRNLRSAWNDPDDVDARTQMMLGATHAGMAFSASSVALVHGMSRPMGAFFHVPHGMGNAMLLSTLNQWSMSHATERFAELSRATGVADHGARDQDAAQLLVDAISALVRDLQIPTLSQFGVEREKWFARIPIMAEQAVASGSPANNPGTPDRHQIESLYQEVWA